MFELSYEQKLLLNKKIKSTSKIFGFKRSQVHDEICRGLLQAAVHGNYTTLTRLLNDCNSEATRKKIIKWIELFSPFEVQQKAPYKFFKGDTGSFEIEKALTTPYWTLVSPEDKIKESPSTLVRQAVSEFLSDPSELNYQAVIFNVNYYKNFASHPQKRALSRKPNNIVQGGASGLKK